MDTTVRDWAGLPVHIVDILVIKLDRFSDYIRFCGVCPEWRDAAQEANIFHKVNLNVLKASRRKLPMLIFKTKEHHNERWGLYDVTYRKTFDVKLPFSYNNKFAGSSCGWLFCTKRNMVVTLVNPINNGCISLPPIKEPRRLFREGCRKYFFDYYIRKGILLSDPEVSPCSFEVVVIYGGMARLAFYKSGEPSWNFIDAEGFFFGDIICYKGKLYGVDVYSQFVEIDLPNRTIRTIVPKIHSWANVVHLVESQDGELLLVRRNWMDNPDDSDHSEDLDVEAENGEDLHLEKENGENLYLEAKNGENLNVEVENGEDLNVEASDNDDIGEIESYDSESDLTPPVEASDNEDIGEIESYDSESDFTPPVRELDDECFPMSYKFKIFKITHPIEEGSATWTEINNIGQQALFVGDNHGISVSTPEFPGCLPNSIYYVTQHHVYIFPYVYRGVIEDSGIYNLKDQKFYEHHMLDSSEKYVQAPIWFLPNPKEMNLG